GRGFGEFDSNKRNARLFSVGIIETDAIGHAEKGGVKLYSDTGDSHRKWNETRQTFIPYFPYFQVDVVERIATKKAGLSVDVTEVKDLYWEECATKVTFREAAAYPFVEVLGVSLSPDIDYRAEFKFQKKGDRVKITLNGARNDFPD